MYLTALNFLAFHFTLSYDFHMNFVCFFLEQIGPNVSISANVRVGAGVRLISCIILDDVEIKVED